MEFVEDERPDMLSFYWKDKLWYRGKNQKQRAISERQHLYNTRGVVISKNETNSNSQTSTVFENPSKFSDAWNFGTEPKSVTDVQQIVKYMIEFWGKGKMKAIKKNKFYEQENLQLDITKAKKNLDGFLHTT